MAQNNLNHYSDLSKYVIFKPEGTAWPSTTKDVQTALAAIGEWARADVGLPRATESVVGITRYATQAEVDSGASVNAAVTPATLKNTVTRPEASTTVLGLTQYATNDEAAKLTLTNRTITAAALGHVFKTVKADLTTDGTVRLTSPAQAQAGTDETTAVTPKRVVEMIAKFSINPPTYSAATESSQGLVRIATQQQVSQGTLHEGWTVTPKTLMGLKATNANFGIVKLAQDADVSAGTATNLAVTPKSIQVLRSTKDKYGLTKLATAPSTDGTLAAAATDAVFKSRKINGKLLDNDIWINSNDVNAYNRQESDGRYMPINRAIGNVTRINAIRLGGGDVTKHWNMNSPWEGVSSMAYTISVKFERNKDGGDNREANFDIFVNDQWRANIFLNVANTKGGRNGHSWRFESFATAHQELRDLPPNARISIRPQNVGRVLEWSGQVIYCTN